MRRSSLPQVHTLEAPVVSVAGLHPQAVLETDTQSQVTFTVTGIESFREGHMWSHAILPVAWILSLAPCTGQGVAHRQKGAIVRLEEQHCSLMGGDSGGAAVTLIEGDQLGGQGVLCGAVGGHDPQETTRREGAVSSPSGQCWDILSSPHVPHSLPYWPSPSFVPTPLPFPLAACRARSRVCSGWEKPPQFWHLLAAITLGPSIHLLSFRFSKELHQ